MNAVALHRRSFLAVVAVLAACGGTTAAPVTTTPTTVAPITTPTTLAPSTTLAAPIATSTTTAATTPDWTPPCAETSGGPVPPPGPYSEIALDTFGPLAARPSLDITLPTGAALPSNPPNPPPFVHAVRIEGGVLFSASASDIGSSKTSILAVVNANGSKRWVRCVKGEITNVWVAPPSMQPKTAAIAVLVKRTATEYTYEWPTISIADGTTQGNLSDLAAKQGISSTDFAHYWIYPVYPPSTKASLLVQAAAMDYSHIEKLAVYEAETNELKAIPVPDEIRGTDDPLVFNDAGEPTVLDTYHTGGYHRVLAVFRGGAWTRDASLLRSALGVQPFFGDPQPGPLIGVNALGTVLWRNASFTDPQVQFGFLGTDGTVVLANVCTARSADNQCTFALVGVELASGRLLWSLPGSRSVSLLANGLALASAGDALAATPPGWVLLNARTGKTVDASQRWVDANAFAIGCCGDSDLVTVQRLGGVVIAVNYTKVRVWYPKAVAGQTQTLSIP